MQFLSSLLLITTLSLGSLCFPHTASAQLLGAGDNCNPLVQSVADVVMVLRQEFVLTDKGGNEFGKDGESFFGAGYAPGIVVNGKLYLSKLARKPFVKDSSYLSYGPDYTPKASDIFYKGIKEKVFKQLTTELTENKTFVEASVAPLIGIPSANNTLTDTMDCLVITFMPDSDPVTDATTYSLSYVYNKVVWKGDKGQLTNEKLGSRTTFGLLFYQSVGVGEAHLEFGGFVEKLGNTWACTPITKLSAITPLEKPKNKKKP